MSGADIADLAAAQGPLVGVRVIDLGTMFAAPFGATLLGDFGADVIKVELPGVGDANRGIVPIVQGIPVTWTALARNKRSITLDIRKERGKEILLRLIATADLVMENFRPGTLEKWGLGYDTMKRANPRPPIALADYVAGTFAAMAALMALHYRDKHHRPTGQQVDVSLYEPLFRMMENVLAEYAYLGNVRERSGIMRQGAVPAGTYQTKDGKWVVMVTSTDRTFNRLAEVMGRADMITDPRYCSNERRCERREEVNGIVQDFFLTKTSAELMRLLDDNGVPVCPINSIADIFQDPQYKARENIIEVDHPVLGKATMHGIVPKFSETPGAVRFPGPTTPGQHNQEIYQGELGISPEEMDALRAEGVI